MGGKGKANSPIFNRTKTEFSYFCNMSPLNILFVKKHPQCIHRKLFSPYTMIGSFLYGSLQALQKTITVFLIYFKGGRGEWGKGELSLLKLVLFWQTFLQHSRENVPVSLPFPSLPFEPRWMKTTCALKRQKNMGRESVSPWYCIIQYFSQRQEKYFYYQASFSLSRAPIYSRIILQ